MDKFQVAADRRDVRGKGASRRLRRAGKVPGVLYGGGKEALSIELGHNELLLHCEDESFYSQILELQVQGASEKVVVKDIQRHPFKPFVMHIDFQSGHFTLCPKSLPPETLKKLTLQQLVSGSRESS